MAPPKTNTSHEIRGSSSSAKAPLKYKNAACETFSAELAQRQILKPWKIFYEDARNLGIKCFDQMRMAGLSSLMDLEEDIYPSIVREFFSNLQFSEQELKADFYLRGISGTLTEGLLAKLLGCEVYEYSIKVLDEVVYEGYDKDKGVQSLTGGTSKNAAYKNLDIESQILFHVLCHVITPKTFNQNTANAKEVFYMWCIRNGLHLNTPCLILSHMKSFLRGEVKDIPYGMLITRIAKGALVYISNQQKVLFTEVRETYNSRLLRHKTGIEEEDANEEGDTSDAAPLIRKRRKLMVSGTSSSSKEPIMDIPQSSRGKQVMEVEKDPDTRRTVTGTAAEEKDTQTLTNPMLRGFALLSDQIEVTSQKFVELSQAMADGFLRLNKRMNSIQKEVESLRKHQENMATERLLVIENKLDSLTSTKEDVPQDNINVSLSLLEERVKKASTSLKISPLLPESPDLDSSD